jgi:antitoxin ParD1/3/4
MTPIYKSLEGFPEEPDPILNALRAAGLVLPQENTITRAEAQKLHQEYLDLLGNRRLGLTQAVLEERSQ